MMMMTTRTVKVVHLHLGATSLWLNINQKCTHTSLKTSRALHFVWRFQLCSLNQKDCFEWIWNPKFTPRKGMESLCFPSSLLSSRLWLCIILPSHCEGSMLEKIVRRHLLIAFWVWDRGHFELQSCTANAIDSFCDDCGLAGIICDRRSFDRT